MVADKALASAKNLDTGANPVEVQSTTESYKRRSNSFFRNPLSPPKELLVNIPDREKPVAYRTPFYRQNNDLIANGIGENARGMPRHTPKETLVGHQSQE